MRIDIIDMDRDAQCVPNFFMSYHETYLQERERLLRALGWMGDGGMVEDCQHIGATRILNEGACVDLALAVFPLDARLDAALAALGYAPQAGLEQEFVKLYRHVSGEYQVWAVESGDEAWLEWTLLPDYLAHNERAQKEYAAARAGWGNDPASKAEYFARAWAAAQQWWIGFYGFARVKQVAQELAGLDVPWYVSGGWALNLFLGQVTRVHHDVDIVLARADQLALREYLTGRGWKFVTPYEGRLEIWGPHLFLKLPRQQVHAHRNGEFIDFQLTDIENGIWKYRREPFIVHTMERVGLKTAEGLPFLAPQVPLLFKSRNTSNKLNRDKDGIDFESVVGALDAEQRAWLRWALLATVPGHVWLQVL